MADGYDNNKILDVIIVLLKIKQFSKTSQKKKKN